MNEIRPPEPKPLASREFVAGLLGEAVAEKLTKIGTGGKSNRDGTRFEDYFAIYQVTVFLSDYLTNPGGFLSKRVIVFISSQADCFVDDLVIEVRKTRQIERSTQEVSEFRHFQLKNTEKKTWFSDTNDLTNRFYWDHAIHKERDEKSTMALVVSDENKHRLMLETIPPALSEFTDVYYFQKPTKLADVIEKNRDFSQLLQNLILAPVGRTRLCAAAKAMLGAWVAHDGSAINILSLAEEIMNEFTPVFRSIPAMTEANESILSALSKVGCRFYIDGGRITYVSEKDGIDGVIPHDIRSRAFAQFLKRIPKDVKIDVWKFRELM